MSNFKYANSLAFIKGYAEGLESDQCEEMQETVDLMETMGGSFVKSLAAAWHHADPFNKRRLVKAFVEYFAEYHQQREVKNG